MPLVQPQNPSSMVGQYQLVGGDGSPYSCKLRAVLRYRRIPHVWQPQLEAADVASPGEIGVNWSKRFPLLRAKVIPVLVRPDGTYTNDSSPIILELDAAHKDRRLIPRRPGTAFLSALLEDFADEWLTKVRAARRGAPPHAGLGGMLQTCSIVFLSGDV